MLSSDEMRNMMKLKNKKKDSNAQAKFYKWYNGLSLDDKSQFDKHCKKKNYMDGSSYYMYSFLFSRFLYVWWK